MTAPTLNKASEKIASRETLRLCTAGSVDDGKSTFVGRLLHDTKSVLADQLASVERTSADRGFEGLDLSLLVDGLRAEREQGITIDVATATSPPTSAPSSWLIPQVTCSTPATPSPASPPPRL